MTTIAQPSTCVHDDDLDRPAPWSYARAGESMTAYHQRMDRRARLPHPAHPLVYLSCAPKLLTVLPVAPLVRHLAPCELIDFATAFPTLPNLPSASARYADTFDDLVNEVSGLVVAVGKSGRIGRMMATEIGAAQERGLPIIVFRSHPGAWNLTAFIDCRIESYSNPEHPWLSGFIRVPPPEHHRSTLRSAKLAMGVARGEA